MRRERETEHMSQQRGGQGTWTFSAHPNTHFSALLLHVNADLALANNPSKGGGASHLCWEPQLCAACAGALCPSSLTGCSWCLLVLVLTRYYCACASTTHTDMLHTLERGGVCVPVAGVRLGGAGGVSQQS